MSIIWGEQKSMRPPHTFHTSIIKTNNSVTGQVYVPDYHKFNDNWYQDVNVNLSMFQPAYHFDIELKQHYWAASFLLPLGSIFVLTVVILLMVLFKRCPQIIAGVVAGLLGIIIIFVIVMSLHNAPVYT